MLDQYKWVGMKRRVEDSLAVSHFLYFAKLAMPTCLAQHLQGKVSLTTGVYRDCRYADENAHHSNAQKKASKGTELHRSSSPFGPNERIGFFLLPHWRPHVT